MAGDDLCPGSFKHLSVFHRFLNGWEDPKFCSHGYGQVLMQCVDCNLQEAEGVSEVRGGS